MNGVADQYFKEYLSLTISLHSSKLKIPTFNKYYYLTIILFKFDFYILKYFKKYSVLKKEI